MNATKKNSMINVNNPNPPAMNVVIGPDVPPHWCLLIFSSKLLSYIKVIPSVQNLSFHRVLPSDPVPDTPPVPQT